VSSWDTTLNKTPLLVDWYPIRKGLTTHIKKATIGKDGRGKPKGINYAKTNTKRWEGLHLKTRGKRAPSSSRRT